MRSFESIREEIIDEEEREQLQFDIEVGKIYYMGGYEDWKVAQLGTVEGTDGYPKHFVTMMRLHDSQLRTILESTFRKKWKLYRN
tara:strand:+ start:222 stop:476 length:255 start_codon:yes stop_codon:yes gene_type:complete